MTGVLKVGPVCRENHEEVDLEEKGEVDGGEHVRDAKPATEVSATVHTLDIRKSIKHWRLVTYGYNEGS